MSKEFKDRLARGELTNTEDYQRMKDALLEANQQESSDEETQTSQEWQNWDLSPAWSSAESKSKPAVQDDGIRADSVYRALDRLDRG